jgi:hypothetical protein
MRPVIKAEMLSKKVIRNQLWNKRHRRLSVSQRRPLRMALAGLPLEGLALAALHISTPVSRPT